MHDQKDTVERSGYDVVAIIPCLRQGESWRSDRPSDLCEKSV